MRVIRFGNSSKILRRFLLTVMARYGHPRWHKKRVITIKRWSQKLKEDQATPPINKHWRVLIEHVHDSTQQKMVVAKSVEEVLVTPSLQSCFWYTELSRW